MAKHPEVSAQYLSEVGCGREMIDALERLGAKIEYADEKSGYALVTVMRENLLSTLDIAGISYAYTSDDARMYYQDPDAKIPQSERKPEPVPQIEIPYPHVAKTLAPDGPYFASDVIGLTELWKQHPEADGRGTRVAVPDAGFDLLHPALQQARDADGKVVPKVADLGTLTTPDEDAGWVRFGATIDAYNGTFEAAGRIWITPAPGRYRFGIFKDTLALGPEDNTHTKKVSLSVGVLWNKQGDQVWVDTDGDGSFKNQRGLRDYDVAYDIDWFGIRKGDEDNRIPFGIKINSVQDAVYIRIGGEHGALVAGPLAANTWTGGLFDGVAPSAQLVDEGLSRVSLVAGMVRMFARPDVDVINRSGGIGRPGYSGLSEGIEDFAQRVLEREVAMYQKPFVAYSAANGTIHVNDFAPAGTLKRNRQLPPPYKDTIFSSVSDLPSGLLNVVLGVSTNLETESRYEPLDLRLSDGRKQSFDEKHFDPLAPDGYVIGSNNSPTIPVVSGIVADLISEAKREHIRYNAVRLNNAIFTGTRLLDGFPVSQQGYGPVNVAQSWNQLSKMTKADDPANPELTWFSVARKENGKFKQVEGFRVEVTHAGALVEGEIWVTRHGGYAGRRRYTFSLRGDDEGFELLDHEATLIRDKAARVRFRVTAVQGWNIALLGLRDVAGDVVMQDVPLSVRAPETPNKVAPGVDKYESAIPPLTSQYIYVRVGDDVQAARYVMRIPYTGSRNISTRFGPGLRYRTETSPPGESLDAAHHVGPMETLESLVANDAPGSQEILWENRGRPEYATQFDGPAPDVPIHAELTVTKYGIAIKRERNSLAFTNKQAAINGKAELYDAVVKTESINGTGTHAMGEIDITLPDRLAQWRLRVTPKTSVDRPADVYLENCSSKDARCYVAATEEITHTMKTLTIDKPAAGKWKIIIRSRDQVSRPINYTVHEALLTPAAAPIEAEDSDHASGDSWSISLPAKTGEAQYAAFRIASTPGVYRVKNGLVIAMTPLDANAP